MEFSVSCRIENNQLISEINYPLANKYTRYAFYLYDGKGKALRKEGYVTDSTFSFLLEKSGSYYVNGFVQSRDYDGGNTYRERKVSNTVLYFQRKKISYNALECEEFKPETPTIYEIWFDGVKYELLISYKPTSDQAVVFGSGSIDMVEKLPVYRRCSWAEQLHCTGIWYFDPTLYAFQRENLKGMSVVGWGYGTNERWYLKDIAHLLQRILERQGICMEDVLFFGSSGGGYMSMALASILRGKATVINPQFFVQNFHDQERQNLKLSVLQPGESLLPERLDILQIFEREGYFPKIHLIQNLQAKDDIFAQLTPLLHRLSDWEQVDTDRLQVDFYSNPGGHNAQPPLSSCLSVFRKDLGSPLCYTGDLEDMDFTALTLPTIMTYYTKEESQKNADDMLHGILQVYPHIESIPCYLHELDLNQSFSRIPTSFRLYLYGLNPVQILTRAYEASKNIQYLWYAYRFIKRWWAYASDEDTTPKSQYVWNAHSASLRAENILYFTKICTSTPMWTDSTRGFLYGLLELHGAWLSENQNYAEKHNHGVMQDLALLHLGILFHRQDWIDLAKERVAEQIKWAFDSEMVHTENSPFYARMTVELLRDMVKVLKHFSDPLDTDLLHKCDLAQEFIDWTILPDGSMAQIGDTGRSAARSEGYKEPSLLCREVSHKVYPSAGVYFYRSAQDETIRNDTWKTIKSGYSKTAHKHADDCSFMLCAKGYEVFVDGGSGIYGYTKDAFRSHFLSSKAHNGIVVDDTSYPCDMSHKDLVGMKAHKFFPNYDHIRVFNNAYESVEWERDFCSSDDLTIVMDSVVSESEHAYSQIFNLSEQMEVISANDREVLLKLADSGYVVRLRQFGDPAELSVIYGDKTTPGYGLISRAENHLDTIITLKFDLTGRAGIFATAITIEDKDGRVRLGDRFEEADQLCYEATTKTFEMGELEIPCRRELFAISD